MNEVADRRSTSSLEVHGNLNFTSGMRNLHKAGAKRCS